MKITIRLARSLEPEKFPKHDHLKGMEVEILDSLIVSDLFQLIGIQYQPQVIVSVNKTIKKWDDKIEDGDFIDMVLTVSAG